MQRFGSLRISKNALNTARGRSHLANHIISSQKAKSKEEGGLVLNLFLVFLSVRLTGPLLRMLSNWW